MKFCVALIWAFMFVIVPFARAEEGGKIKVVATHSILGDIVKNIGGDRIDLTVLVGPDGDAHTFEPTPKEGIVLAEAVLIFENGLHFEHWLNDLYASSGSKAQRVTVTEGIETITLEGDVDPHAWQDVSNAMVMAELVREGLSETDPANAAYYKEHADKYLAALGELDYFIIDTLKDIPEENRKVVTSHDALGYYAKRYGLQVIGAAIPSGTTEAEDPSARQTAMLLDIIKSAGVKALFAENVHNKKLIETLSQETGVRLAPDLYTDALGAEGSEGDTYIKMMRHNTGIFAEYLK